MKMWADASTEQRVAAVDEMLSLGLSRAVIAERLGTTRNAVISLVFRNKDLANKFQRKVVDRVVTVRKSAQPKPVKASPIPPLKPLRAAPIHSGNLNNKKLSRENDAMPSVPRHAAFLPLAASRPVMLQDAAADQCKFPIDGFDGPGTLWCGDHAAKTPYCAAHARLAYSDIPPRKIKEPYHGASA